ncbi:hypothetical protein BDR26DRAFT_892747 [Obelidium mucronatum]|nr:hypothetical protein BDR26DRAFT_892747 [Obelidium mucronatum]
MPRRKKSKPETDTRPWEHRIVSDHEPNAFCFVSGQECPKDDVAMDTLLNDLIKDKVDRVIVQDPNKFVCGGVNTLTQEKKLFWNKILTASTRKQADTISRWLSEGPTVEEFATSYYKDSKLPPKTFLKNGKLNQTLKDFAEKKTQEELKQGIRINVGERKGLNPDLMPHLVSPTGVVDDQVKMRKYDNCTYLNNWCKPPKFNLPYIQNLTSWMSRFYTVIDFKSCFMNILIHPASRKYFGTYGTIPGDPKEYVFVATTLVFGWNCSPYIEQTIVEAIVRYIRMIKVRTGRGWGRGGSFPEMLGVGALVSPNPCGVTPEGFEQGLAPGVPRGCPIGFPGARALLVSTHH